MQMSKEIKKYQKEIKLLLPAFNKDEKKFLRDLMERIEDYLDENSNATMQDIENQFGTPMEIAQSYMSSLDLDVLLKRLSISHFVRRFFAIAAICMILGLCVYSICMYKAYICYKDTLVTNSETVIVDQNIRTQREVYYETIMSLSLSSTAHDFHTCHFVCGFIEFKTRE